jgi:hypothetical protein
MTVSRIGVRSAARYVSASLMQAATVHAQVSGVANPIIQAQRSSLYSASVKPLREEPIFKWEESEELDGDSGDSSDGDSSVQLMPLLEAKPFPILQKGSLAAIVMKNHSPMKKQSVTITHLSKETEQTSVERYKAEKEIEDVVITKTSIVKEETEVIITKPSMVIDKTEVVTKKSLLKAIAQSKAFMVVGILMAVVGVLAAAYAFPVVAQTLGVNFILKKLIGTAIKAVMPFLLPVVSTGIVALGSVFAVTYIANKLFGALKKPVYDATTSVISGMNNLPGARAIKFVGRNALYLACPLMGR